MDSRRFASEPALDASPRWTRAVLLALIAAAVSLSACGEQPPPADDESAREEGEPARLVVREVLPERPRYTEGSLSFLRVEATGSGRVVVDGPRTDGREVRGETPLLDRRLPAGEYRIVSYQRPCVGTCDQLDPPTDRCETTARLAPDEKLSATIVLALRGGCTIRRR